MGNPMTAEEQLLRDIEDYSKNPYNKWIVNRAKIELAELQKQKVLKVEAEISRVVEKIEVTKKIKSKKK